MKTRAFLVHALSSLHAGTGQAAEIIDLPIARMQATGIPFVPGSSLKGVLRDARSAGAEPEKIEAAFGPSDDPGKHSGALVVGDARLLALPVQCFRGTFAWITSPLLLALAKRDLNGASNLPVPVVDSREARTPGGSACVYEDRIYLNDLDLQARQDDDAATWAHWLAPIASPGTDIFTKRFVIVDDETMAFLAETATQVDARVRIDGKTRTVAKGALWLEESLPSETLLIGVLAADRSRRAGVNMTPDEVLDFVLSEEIVVQVGGKASIGRGRCRWIPVFEEV